MPSATNSGTTALLRIDGAEEGDYSRFSLPASGLLAGRDLIAVAVHQCGPASNDLFFDLRLNGYRDGEESMPAAPRVAAREATSAFRSKHFLPSGQVIPDGSADGGRKLEAGTDGNIQSDREFIVVDRDRDTELQKHLAFAESDLIAKLPQRQRAQFLALYVEGQFSPPAGRNAALATIQLIEAEFRNREMLLGQAAGAGVCRHRALLFKILADEAGLPVAIARGNLGTAESSSGHAWNELTLANGKRLIVDWMNPQGGFDFPETASSAALRYLTVEKTAYYPGKSLSAVALGTASTGRTTHFAIVFGNDEFRTTNDEGSRNDETRMVYRR